LRRKIPPTQRGKKAERKKTRRLTILADRGDDEKPSSRAAFLHHRDRPLRLDLTRSARVWGTTAVCALRSPRASASTDLNPLFAMFCRCLERCLLRGHERPTQTVSALRAGQSICSGCLS